MGDFVSMWETEINFESSRMNIQQKKYGGKK